MTRKFYAVVEMETNSDDWDRMLFHEIAWEDTREEAENRIKELGRGRYTILEVYQNKG